MAGWLVDCFLITLLEGGAESPINQVQLGPQVTDDIRQ